MDLASVTTELYGLEPGDFRPARDARVREAKDAGNPALAAEIAKLRRPTVSAWLANALVREHPHAVYQLLDLAERTRRAQAGLDVAAMRELPKERQQLIGRLVRAAREIAEGSGTGLSDTTTSELLSTLQAATIDAGAGDALRSGCLVHALSYSGFGGVAPAEATPDEGGRNPPPAGAAGRSRRDPRPSGSRVTSRERADAQEIRRIARNEEAEATKKHRAASRGRVAAERELERRQLACTAGEEQLAALKQAERQARDALQSAKRGETSAERALRAAKKRRAEAEAVVTQGPEAGW